MTSREIKFRAKDIQSGKYFPTKNGLEFQIGNCLFEINDIVGFKSVLLEQYTGIKDKNGQEIYEGDLVNFNWRTHGRSIEEETNQEVYFSDGIFYFGKSQFAMNDCNFMDETLEIVNN